MSSNLASALARLLSASTTPTYPAVQVVINGHPADVSGLVGRLLSGEKLSYDSVISYLTPEVIKELMPYADKILALVAGRPSPSPLPIPVPLPNDDEKPIPIITIPPITYSDPAIEAIWADWLGDSATATATPEQIAAIKAGTLDLPPNGQILFGAVCEPSMDPRLLDGLFAYHFLISGKKSGELAHIIVDRREITDNPYLKSVPNRWFNDGSDPARPNKHYPGWQAMIKFIPFYGDPSAEDRWIDYWLVTAGFEGQHHRISWRHHGFLPKVNG